MVLERLVHSTNDLQRSDLIALTGMTEDIMTFWLRKDLVEPIGGKTGIKGKKLLFPYYEANLIAVLLQLRLFGANIDALKGVASIYRAAISWGAAHNLTNREGLCVAQTIEKVAGLGKDHVDTVDAILDRLQDKHPEFIAELNEASIDFAGKILPIISTMSHSQYVNECIAFNEITAQPMNDQAPHATFFWPTPSGWKRGFGDQGLLRAKIEGSFATLAIDIFGILYSVWNKPTTSSPDLRAAH